MTSISLAHVVTLWKNGDPIFLLFPSAEEPSSWSACWPHVPMNRPHAPVTGGRRRSDSPVTSRAEAQEGPSVVLRRGWRHEKCWLWSKLLQVNHCLADQQEWESLVLKNYEELGQSRLYGKPTTRLSRLSADRRQFFSVSTLSHRKWQKKLHSPLHLLMSCWYFLWKRLKNSLIFIISIWDLRRAYSRAQSNPGDHHLT